MNEDYLIDQMLQMFAQLVQSGQKISPQLIFDNLAAVIQQYMNAKGIK